MACAEVSRYDFLGSNVANLLTLGGVRSYFVLKYYHMNPVVVTGRYQRRE